MTIFTKKYHFSIYAYSVASTSSAAYVIGGKPAMESISKFENNVWSIVGSLLHKRAVHASILYNGEIFIAGGEAPDCWNLDSMAEIQ